jgi:hypothetical protein
MLDPKLYCDFRAHALYLLDQYGFEESMRMVKDAKAFCQPQTHSYTFHTETMRELEEMRKA